MRDDRTPAWRKSTYSNTEGACVEIARASGGRALVRDSKDRRGLVLRFSDREWSAFAGAVKAGGFY